MMLQAVNGFLFASVAAATDSSLVRKSAGETVTTTPTELDWGAEVYDRTAWHDTVTNNPRLNVITGVTLARVVTGCAGNSNTLETRLDGSSFVGKGRATHTNNGAPNTPGTNVTSAITAVTAGSDYFACYSNTASGNVTPGTESRTWAFIEAINGTTNYCFAKLTSNKSTNNGTVTVIQWDTASGTQSGWYSAGNPSRITPNVTLVRLTGNVIENNVATNTRVRALKNGAVARGLPSRHTNNAGQDAINFASAPLVLNGSTDYLEVEVLTTGASSILTDDGSWFQVEEVPSTYKRCLAYKTSNQNLLASATGRIYWDATEYDTDSILQTISSTVTITIASPGVVSWTAHGLSDGDPIKLLTTGALPTGLTAGTIYYVKSSTANDFQLAASPGGAAINTSGSQSGTHTATNKSRLKAPAGVTQARASYSVSLSASTAGVDFSNTGSEAAIQMNKADFYGQARDVTIANAGVRSLSGLCAWVDVTASTDYFELLQANYSQARDVVADEYTWLCVEFR